MNYEKLFSHIITVVLLGMAAYFQSSALAYAAVLSSAVNAVYSIYSRLVAVKEQKPGLNEEARRVMQDLGARIATIEYGVKTRGF
ncbi:hypothetical protein LCGC14_2702530 [marine sediment metagenome]|uniref:Uncharacterized protein n=1 Tax=marine sediment metagenome TaxID=412755 RepID=A0A0F9BPM4_9ZZZZ